MTWGGVAEKGKALQSPVGCRELQVLIREHKEFWMGGGRRIKMATGKNKTWGG